MPPPSSPAATRLWPTTSRLLTLSGPSITSTEVLPRAKRLPLVVTRRMYTTTVTLGTLPPLLPLSSFMIPSSSGSVRVRSLSTHCPSPSSATSSPRFPLATSLLDRQPTTPSSTLSRLMPMVSSALSMPASMPMALCPSNSTATLAPPWLLLT